MILIEIVDGPALQVIWSAIDGVHSGTLGDVLDWYHTLHLPRACISFVINLLQLRTAPSRSQERDRDVPTHAAMTTIISTNGAKVYFPGTFAIQGSRKGPPHII